MKNFTFKRDSENQSDNFYLIYVDNYLFAKTDIEERTIRFYDKDTTLETTDLVTLSGIINKMYSKYMNEVK